MSVKIAFAGKARSGKDTACDFLIKEYGGTKVAFAKPLYDILYYAQDRCGISRSKDRKFLQYIGTEWGRSINNNMWVDLALHSVPRYGNVFLSDLRFPNELQALKQAGWVCIKLVRQEDQVGDDRISDSEKTHTSETSLDSIPDSEFEYVIENNSSMEVFREKLSSIYQNIYTGKFCMPMSSSEFLGHKMTNLSIVVLDKVVSMIDRYTPAFITPVAYMCSVPIVSIATWIRKMY